VIGIAPATLLTTAMLGFPLFLLFLFGFIEIDRGVFTGRLSARGYIEVFLDPFYREVFLRTLLIALLVTILCLLFGYPIAYLFYKASSRWKAVILLCVLAPLLTSTLVRTFGWMVILGREGALNKALLGLRLIERPISFLFVAKGVLIGMVQVLLPFMILPLMASLETTSHELEEAATNLGASGWEVFWRVTVPQTIPGIAGGVSLVFVLAFSEFPVPVLLGGATFKVLPVYIFQTMAILLDWSRGAALASVLLLGSAFVVLLLQTLFRKAMPWMQANSR
jgi:ABC-type spermidine/putrescine transport system permease subunit I